MENRTSSDQFPLAHHLFKSNPIEVPSPDRVKTFDYFRVTMTFTLIERRKKKEKK